MASSVTRRTVVSYTAFPPLPQCCQAASGGISLLHYPWSRLHRTLSGILPCEARTFLTCSYEQPRSSVLLAPCYSNTPHLFCQTVHSYILSNTHGDQAYFKGKFLLVQTVLGKECGSAAVRADAVLAVI